MIVKKYAFLIGAFLAGIPNAQAQAQTLSEIDRLHFGTFAIIDNNAQAAVTVTPDNDTFADSQIVIGENGQRGVYQLTDLPPNVNFFLGTDVPNPPSEGGLMLGNEEAASNGAGPDLRLSNLTIGNGGLMMSDNLGEATLYIGGTIQTTGNGQTYTGGNYVGSYTITIYY